jgi:HSP20 family molecular chaperone IbpA
MSALNLFNELRPLFRLLEEPVPRAFGAFHHPHHHHQPRSFGLPRFSLAQPSLELAEEDGKYVVEAELPGVRKEDVKVTVGEGGRALTISGSRSSRRLLNSTNTDPAAESKAELKGSSTNSNTTTDDTSSTPAPVTDVKGKHTLFSLLY